MKVVESIKIFISSWGFALAIIPFIILLVLGACEVLGNLSGAMAGSALMWSLVILGTFILVFLVLLAIALLIVKYEG